MCPFQYINFQYLNLFSEENFEGLTDDQLITTIETNIAEYNRFNYYGTLFSGTLVVHLISKLWFNLFAEVKLPVDLWTLIDMLSSFANIIAFNVIGSITPEQIIDT